MSPRVPTIMSPEDEAAFAQEMKEMADQAPKQEFAEESPAVQQQLDRKRSLDRLLLFKKPAIKTFTISGVQFRIKRLNPDDSMALYKELIRLPEDEQASKLEIFTLAAAVIDMDGIRLEELYMGPASIESPLLRRYLELCAWDFMLIRALSRVYADFVQEAEKEYTPSFLEKASPKTPITV